MSRRRSASANAIAPIPRRWRGACPVKVMSEPENFLDRWSRRKREAGEPEPPRGEEKAPAPQPASAAKDSPAAKPAPAGKDAPAADTPFDVSKLPSLDSI